mmetsp:Transcript_13136/g.34355  ORF Transcript_13136/g.34355 Transcript_13136/m.34355 type:complete len:204 (+) Transcript_13136:2401-3012(+)
MAVTRKNIYVLASNSNHVAIEENLLLTNTFHLETIMNGRGSILGDRPSAICFVLLASLILFVVKETRLPVRNTRIIFLNASLYLLKEFLLVFHSIRKTLLEISVFVFHDLQHFLILSLVITQPVIGILPLIAEHFFQLVLLLRAHRCLRHLCKWSFPNSFHFVNLLAPCLLLKNRNWESILGQCVLVPTKSDKRGPFSGKTRK